MTDATERTDPTSPQISAADLVRALRLVLRVSQRELATEAGLSRSTVDRIESGALEPRLGQLDRVLGLANWHLGVWDPGGDLGGALARLAHPFRDGAGRHYPAHLDLIVDPVPGEWWGDRFGFQSPPETFKVDWGARELRRAQSQWDLARGPYKGRPNLPRPSAGPALPRLIRGPATQDSA
jgi:transcriptional regulator with XRE-family HTH domain